MPKLICQSICPNCPCPISAEQNLRSMGRRVMDLPQDQLQRTVKRERPEGYVFVERVSELQILGGSYEPRQQVVEYNSTPIWARELPMRCEISNGL